MCACPFALLSTLPALVSGGAAPAGEGGGVARQGGVVLCELFASCSFGGGGGWVFLS